MGALPHHEITQIEHGPEYGDFTTEIDTGRILAAIGRRDNHTYVSSLHTPLGINVLETHTFGGAHHNGIFLTHNNVQFEDRNINFCCNTGAWYNEERGYEPVEEHGIIHQDKAPTIELLPEGMRFIYEMTWRDSNDVPIFDEIRTIDIYDTEDGTFCDVMSQHIASYGDLQFPLHNHGCIGVHAPPHFVPSMGGQLTSWTGEYGYYSRGHTTYARFIALERTLRDVGSCGVCVSVLSNSKPTERRLRGPWLTNNGIIMYFPTMRDAVELDAGDTWTFGIRVIAYDGLFDQGRAEDWNDRLGEWVIQKF